MWLAAWELVSNGAKRTIPLPNAKHSTLLQGCFLCFCFSLHSQFRNKVNHCPPVFSTEPFYPWLRVERMPASRLAVSSVSVAVSMLVESKRSCALL